ncbi:hypothetical protein [Sporosarcina sp. Te-1]|uniref:hypothetical protein n=1 Tax=Sporosarcina sp. Te-1 TaxID=2818390 RepID=UPI001A9E5281|nr:hypothetical protein [Sporosarcina sp. Te-1]QTD42587.1 hypothetical protein J3U78_07215 [Sporosarcina sp. Te-1]
MRNIYIILASLFLFVLIGCQQIGPAAKPVNQFPTIKVRIGEETFSAARGSYCWTTRNLSECADASGDPFDYENSAPPIEVEPGSKIELLFSETPSSLSVEMTKNGKEETLTDQAVFSIPAESGTYGFSVHANWEEGDMAFHFILIIK